MKSIIASLVLVFMFCSNAFAELIHVYEGKVLVSNKIVELVAIENNGICAIDEQENRFFIENDQDLRMIVPGERTIEIKLIDGLFYWSFKDEPVMWRAF